MKRYIIDKKEDIRALDVKPRIVEFPKTKFIVSIIGPRRAGKTYSLYDFILKKGLNDDEFLFVNLEDETPQRKGRDEVLKAISYHEEIYGKEPEYIFLDEIQAMEKWERYLYTIFEKKRYNIFVTGSSSKLLSKEIATELRGRGLSLTILPLSFAEFLSIKRFNLKEFYSTREENKIKNLLWEYLRNGGFPDVVIENINARRFFKDYIDLVIFRDLMERFDIRNTFLIRFLINAAISSFGKEFSINKIYSTLKSQNVKVGRKTLYSYSLLLEDVMFSFLLHKFSFSTRKTMLSIPKIYLNDTGLINHTFLNFSENIGQLIENAVFLELKRREKEIYYWKDYSGKEVDFVVKEGLDVGQLIQVCYDISGSETKERELKSLIKASNELKCDNLLVITWDYEGEEEFKGKRIRFLCLWRWLLGMS